MHEATQHKLNSFVTLTYDENSIPEGQTLVKKDLQDFIRGLRQRIGRASEGNNTANKIRFFGCGEYGEKFDRPHYHVCIFGYNFPDKKKWKKSQDNILYTSEEIEKIWKKGFNTVGELTVESAAYTARYVMKKINGDKAASHYEILIPETGEIIQRQPEFMLCSLKPGIANEWFNKYQTDVYPTDECIQKGKQCKPPRYYDKLYERYTPEGFSEIKDRRKKQAEKNAANTTPAKMKVKKEILLSRLIRLKRKI